MPSCLENKTGYDVFTMDDYAYINARIRASRARLLTAKAFEEMIGLPDLPSTWEYLVHSVYGKEGGEIPAQPSLPAGEEWLRDEWSRTISKFYRITDGLPKEYLEILLGRYEVENIKSILRGKKADIGLSEILATVLPTGFFDEAALGELARQPSIQAVVDMLTTWRSPYARPLRKMLSTQRELKGLESLELALDQYYYQWAIGMLKDGDPDAKLLHALIGLFIDRVNLLSAFKISSEGVSSRSDIPGYFIEGGAHVPISVYNAVVRAQDLMEIIEAVRKTPYSVMLEGMETEQGGIPPSIRLERALERFILDKARAMSLTDPLGIGLMMYFLLQKYHEVANIRIILRAKVYDMYPEDVRSLLVV
jgi:V/A-type H+/Na+-transporting ATPase subunit C